MFHAMMDRIGVMDIIAPFAEPSELVMGIQTRDWERTMQALNSDEPRTMLTVTKCGVLHLAAQYNFVQLVEHLRNQNAAVNELDAVRRRMLVFVCADSFCDLTKWHARPPPSPLLRTATPPCTMPRGTATSSPPLCW